MSGSVLTGTSSGDAIDGGAESNVINSGAGNDTIDGGAGSDRLNGGSGADVLIYRLSENLTLAGTTDLYSGGSGRDTVQLIFTREEWASPGVQSQLADYLAHLAAVTNAKTDEVSNGSASDFTFHFYIGNKSSTLTVSMIENVEWLVAPSLSAADASGNSEDGITLAINAGLTSPDGSDSLSITITGLPDGWVLSAGESVAGQPGAYALSPQDLAGLQIIPPPGMVATVTLTVVATATEASTGATISTSDTFLVSVTDADAVQGQVIDGYIVDATVFADANNNGVLDGGEAWTTTDATGNFTLAGGSGPLVAIGGTDVSTLLPFGGVLRAPEGATVITPLTTLIADLVYREVGAQSLAEATANVASALGLAGLTIDGDPIDLLTFDPVVAATTGGSDGAAAAQVLSAAIRVQNAIVQISALLEGASATNAGSAVVGALADLVAAGTPVSLVSVMTIENLIGAAAQAATGDTDINAVVADAVAVLVTSNSAVDAALTSGASGLALLTDLAQVAVVAQGALVTNALADAGSSNNADTIGDTFTGVVTESIETAPVGDVSGGDVGTPGNDAMIGSAGKDLMRGLAGDDALYGLQGNDTLSGGPGHDLLSGGVISKLLTPDDFRDLDRVDYSTAASGVTVHLGLGTAQDDGDGGTDTLIGIEGVVGSAHNDSLNGSDTTFYEFFIPGAGNDTIDGGGFNDRVFYDGASGPIIVTMGSANPAAPNASGLVTGDASVGIDSLLNVEQIRGTSFNDTYTASGFVSASGSNGLLDTFNEFDGGGGDDTITGNGTTRASYLYAPGPVEVTLIAADTVNGGSFGNATGGDGNDTLFGINQVRGSNYGDTFWGGTTTGSQIWEGRGGNDTIHGGPGYDQARYAFDGPISTGIHVNLAAGIVAGDPVYTGTDTLYEVEAIRGTILNDVYDARGFGLGIPGTTNVGSLGTFNEFEGTAGDDTIYTNSGANPALLPGQNFGGTRVSYLSARDAVTVDLDTGTEVIGGVTYLKGGATGDASVGTDTFYGVVAQVRGSNFNDTIIGRNNIGFTPNPTFLYSEIYQGRGGDDTIDGGGGWDIVWYNEDFTSQGISVVRHGTDADKLIVAGDKAIGTDTLIHITSIRGTEFADTFDLTGYAPGAGWSGASTLLVEIEGGGGNDVITGNGATRMTYVNSTSAVTGDLAAGTASGTAVGTDTFVSGVRDLRGSNFNDTLVGNASTNFLEGQSGNDTLRGAGGNDSLDGGANIDLLDFSDATGAITFTLVGGAPVGGGFWSTGGLPGIGTDSYRNMEGVIGSIHADSITGSNNGLNFNEVYEGRAGNDTFYGGGGADEVNYSNDGALAGVLVQMAYFGPTSGRVDGDAAIGTDTLNNIIVVRGTNFADTYDATGVVSGIGSGFGLGFNEFEGRGGDDTIIGNGETRASFINSTSGVEVNLAEGTAVGAATGNDTLSGVYSLRGSNLGDTLLGSGGNEFFDGRGGNDLIDGGDGVDRAFYNVADAGGTFTANALGVFTAVAGNQGTDTLTNIERIVGTNFNDTYDGTVFNGAMHFEGGTGNDTISGGAGNDTFNGGDGADSMTGGIGADIINADGVGNDVVVFNSLAEAGDTINGFNAGPGGDVLKISDLLDVSTDYGDGAGGKILADYVRIDASGGNGLLQIDPDGTGGGSSWQTLATITGGSSLTLQTLLDGNNILVT